MKERFEFEREDYEEGFIHKYSAEIFSYLTIAMFVIAIIGIGFAYYLSTSPKQTDMLDKTIRHLQKDIIFSS